MNHLPTPDSPSEGFVPVTQSGSSLSPPVLANFARALVVTMVFCLAVHVVFGVGAIRYRNPDIGRVEPNIVFAIQRLALGHPLYEDPERSPFGITQYSPLYYLLASRIVTWLDIDPRTDVWSVYAVARSVEFAAWLLSALLIYLLAVRLLHLGPRLGLVLAAVALIVPGLDGVAARPDSAVRFMTVAAFYCYLAAETAESRGGLRTYLAISFGLIVVAVWTKQPALQVAAIVAILLVLRKRWLALVWMCASFVAGSFLIYRLTADSLGGWGPFYQNVVTGAFSCGVHIDWAANVYERFFVTYGAVVSGFVGTLYVYLTRAAKRSHDLNALFVASGIMLLTAVASFIKWGIGLNHAYDAITFMLLAIATFWWRQAQARQVSIAWIGGVAVAFAYVGLFALTQTAAMAFEHHNIVWHPERDHLDVGSQDRVVEAMQVELQRYPGARVFAYWLPYVNVRLPEAVVVPQVELVGMCSYPRGVFSYDRFAAGVRSGEIKYVVTELRQRLTSYAGADFRDFTPLTTIGNYVILTRGD